MKKSKFLKKSLAMLLALMLVVAMIPLSASAAGALPNLTRLYIDDIDVALEADGSTFKADIARTANDVDIRVDAYALSTTEGNATLEVVKPTGSEVTVVDYNAPSAPNDTNIDPLTDWGTESGDVVTLKLRVISKDKTAQKEYTLELTRVDTGVTADINKVEAGDGVYKATFDNTNRTVNLEVVRGYAAAGGAKFTVYTKDNATVEDNSGSATVGSAGSTISLVTVNADKKSFQIKSQSTNNVVVYTVHVTEIDGLLSLNLGDYKGVITDDDSDGTPDLVTVTMPMSAARDELGYVEDEVRLPVTFSVYGNSPTVEINSADYKSNDVINLGQLLDSANNGTVYASNNLVNGSGVDVKLSCAGCDDVQTYKLKIQFEKSNNTAISYAQLDGEIATIEGNKISAVLPAKKANNDPTTLNAVQVLLYTDPSVQAVSGFIKAQSGDQTVAGKTVWYAGSTHTTVGTLNLLTSKIITVQAQDGSTSQYTISATIDSNKDEAYLTAMSLKNGNTDYKGTIKDHTITFTVPYMTIDASEWKVYATPNTSANVVGGNSASNSYVSIVNGTSTLGDLADTTDHASVDFTSLATTDNTNKGTIVAVNKNDDSVMTKYTVVINLTKPATGKTLKSLTFSAQGTKPTGEANDKVTARVNNANTIKAEVKDSGLVEDNVGVITLRAPYSLSATSNYNIVTNFETINGGVAYLAQWDDAGTMFDGAVELVALPNNKDTFAGNSVQAGNFGADATAKVDDNWCILVLPEDEARAVNVAGTGKVAADNLKKSTIYNIVEDPKDPSTEQDLKSVSVKNTNLSIGNTNADVELIKGTLPWSLTAAAETETDKGLFLTIETKDAYAVLTSDGNSNLANRFYSDGDKDGDGYADSVDANNKKILFKRNADHTVDVYTSDDGSTYTALGASATKNQVTVVAEDGTSIQKYKFQLTWADPNTAAVISSFKLANANGSISSDRKISVTVPYGTDLKGLIPTFTASSGAKVEVANGGAELISGKTAINFTNPVNLIVTSEDGKKTMNYTVTVTVADQFSDVNEGDWFYQNVMDAAANGYVSGEGNGLFNPYGATTRAAFAAMIANAMDFVATGDETSPFVDVSDNHWAAAAIAFCYENGYLGGYEDGTFRPNQAITRQEAAAILNNTFGLSDYTTDEKFVDDASIATWARAHVYAAKASGVMSGDVAGTFRPNDTIIRAEAASIMMNANRLGFID